MELNELKKLIKKYNNGQASAEETSLVENWFDEINGNEPLINKVNCEKLKKDIRVKVNFHISSHDKGEGNSILRLKSIKSLIQAAILLIILSTTFYFYLDTPDRKTFEKEAAGKYSNDIESGGDKATLTLANGSKIILNEVENGVIVKEGNTLIQKTQEGQLIYDISNVESRFSDVEFNTISTPKGGQYQVILSDGTKVWLNAKSSLKFPTKFIGKERTVELTGEAYFEVARNVKNPFNVQVGRARIEVLGTHFNVMAYSDEVSLQTTLLEGSVKVSVPSGGKSSILVPGQQASIDKSNNLIILDADVEEITAWKNGYFHFNRDHISEIMKKFARWYDIEVIYEGKMPSDEFVGKIRRSVTLMQAVEMLKLTHVNFRVDGRTVTVSGQ